MKKTIFALWGGSDSGKTTTISRVYHRFKMEGAKLIYRGDKARKRRNGAAREIKGAILEIDGVLVGFASAGDKREILEPYLDSLIADGCIIIVCATHTRGGTVDVVLEQKQRGYNIKWIEKNCTQEDNDDGNQKKANQIVTAVREAIEMGKLVEA